jgi:hypothetical protein
MALNAHKDPMTDQQRQEIKQLCREADIPDKSGELLTRSGAQDYRRTPPQGFRTSAPVVKPACLKDGWRLRGRQTYSGTPAAQRECQPRHALARFRPVVRDEWRGP